MFTMGIALALGGGPAGNQTPCQWAAEQQESLSLVELIAAVEEHAALFTQNDRWCLKGEGVHKSVLKAIRDANREVRVEAAGVRQDEREEDRAVRAAELAERQATREAEAAEALAERLSERYDVAFIAVFVGPANVAKGPRAAWDGLGGPVPAGTMEGALGVAGLLTGVVPVAGLGSVLAFAQKQGDALTSLPDVYGYAEFMGRERPSTWPGTAVSLRSPKAACSDTLYCDFKTAVFHGVRMREGDTIKLVLKDSDFDDDDSVGTVSISAAEVRAAVAAGENVIVPKHATTQGQLLGVVLNARQSTSTTPSVEGYVFRR